MRPTRLWRGSSRTLGVLLVAFVLPPAAMLVWLGLQLLQQDRSLLVQRETERRAAVVASAVHALESSLADAERRLVGGDVPDEMVRLTFSKTHVEPDPADRIAWVPVPRPMRAVENAQFAEAETLEFRGGEAQALRTYQGLAGSRDVAVRAGALLRVARVFRQQRRWDDALRSYRILADIRDVAIEGTPADLQARRAACDVMAESGQTAALVRAADALDTDLVAGRWLLDGPAWKLATADVERWTSHRFSITTDRTLLSEVAAELWNEYQRGAWPGRPLSGRRLVVAGDTAVTVVWQTQGSRTVALALTPAVLRSWTARLIKGNTTTGDRLSVVAPTGQVLAGSAPGASGAAVRMAAADTGLPWTVVVTPSPTSPLTAEFAVRQRLLLIGLIAILMLLASGSYFLWRVVRRELAVVRQQQDFVAAVSHEFRTPLTSMRHVTELLQESDDVPPDRRSSFYGALGRNTERLQRLVESLLDFSRMEGGKKPYDLQSLEAGELAASVVAEFRREVGPRGVGVHLDVDEGPALSVRGDAAALTNALWNLLDNAVKYSPDSNAVHVSIARRGADVVIAVRDQGLGIPAAERKDVFRRFVRGGQAARLGIKGTGLGLAIVSHIVSAHGGTIELESEEGAGSTFTIVLRAAGADSRTP